jgi:tetratricopeptide (TPR) repeat protein
MSKSSRRQGRLFQRAGVQQSETAHLDSLAHRAQSLLQAQRPDEALQLLESNAARFGKFAAFHALLATVYGELGQYRDAAVHARLALDLDPKTADHYLLAAIAYMAAGYYSLAYRVRQQWLRSAPRGHPALAEMRRLDEEYRRGSELLRAQYRLRNAKIAEEAGYRLDEGRWALDQGRWADALHHSRAAAELVPGWPPPRNNASTALYFLGRYDEAIAEAETVLRRCDADNVHALANLVRYCLTIGDAGRVREYGDRLVRLPIPDNQDDAVKQVEGLSVLDRDEDIDRILKHVEQEFGALPATAYLHWGIAVANLGRRKEALAHLRRARAAGSKHPLLKDTLAALERGQPGRGAADRFSYTHFSDLIPREAFEQIVKAVQREEEAGTRDDRAWAELLRRYPQMPMVARKMLYENPESVSLAVQWLGFMRSPAAVEALREFALGSKGDQGDRLQALHTLQETGQLPPGAQVEMWIDGQRRLIETVTQEISDEFVPDYPQAVWDTYHEALTAYKAGRIADAERAYERMLELAPDAKEAYNNLAVIYAERGETARANEYLDKALQIDSLYPFPRTTRALQALVRGNVEEAKKWLDPLHTVSRWHPLGFVTYQKAMARIAIAEEKYEVARNHLETAQEINPEDKDIQDLLDRLRLLEVTRDVAGRWRERTDAYRRRRQRAQLPADPTLEDCFGRLTRGDMTGISQVLNLQGISALKKADLQRYMVNAFADTDFLGRVVRDLNDAERAALRDVLDHGGVMDWQAFAEKHGDDLAESPYLDLHAGQMKTVMGRLRARGLLFEGTTDGRLIVAIPRQVRPLLRQLLDELDRTRG